MQGIVLLLFTVAQATELINETNTEYYLLLDALNETENNYTYFNESEYNITYPSCLNGECPANTSEYTITIPVPCPIYYKTIIEGADDIHDCMYDGTPPINNTGQRRAEKLDEVQIGFIATVGAVAGTSAVVAGVVVGLQAAGVLPSSLFSGLGGLIVAKKVESAKPERPNMFRNIKIEPVHLSKPHALGLSRKR